MEMALLLTILLNPTVHVATAATASLASAVFFIALLLPNRAVSVQKSYGCHGCE